MPATDLRSSPADAPELNPYVDYARYLTAEGGVLIVYKDLDLRWRHTLWRLFAWACFTGPEAWAAMRRYDDANPWFAIAGITAVAILNIVIVAKPVELYRRMEIRPDCLIIEGEDVFWMRYMDGGFPSFHPDEQGNLALCGIYGTRFVQYLVVRHFDEFDRMPEIFAAHLRDAMQQLWTQPP